MKILSVRHAVPTTILTNEDMIERIVAANRSIVPADQLAALVTEVREYLARVGTNTRHAADGHEAAIDVLRGAVQRALDAAKVQPGDLDFIIYAGVNRGWLEPFVRRAGSARIRGGEGGMLRRRRSLRQLGSRDADCRSLLQGRHLQNRIDRQLRVRSRPSRDLRHRRRLRPRQRSGGVHHRRGRHRHRCRRGWRERFLHHHALVWSVLRPPE